MELVDSKGSGFTFSEVCKQGLDDPLKNTVERNLFMRWMVEWKRFKCLKFYEFEVINAIISIIWFQVFPQHEELASHPRP